MRRPPVRLRPAQPPGTVRFAIDGTRSAHRIVRDSYRHPGREAAGPAREGEPVARVHLCCLISGQRRRGSASHVDREADRHTRCSGSGLCGTRHDGRELRDHDPGSGILRLVRLPTTRSGFADTGSNPPPPERCRRERRYQRHAGGRANRP